MPSDEWKKKYSFPIMAIGIAVLFASARFGSAITVLVGLPLLLIACGIVAGARRPSQIPSRDALVYFGIAFLIVLGLVLYAMYSV